MESWNRVRFDYPNIPTMVTREEQRYLFWLGAQYWKDVGHVVEIGPWLGGSTACLAAGMMQRPEPPNHLLHVFDNFIWRDFMADRAALPIANGESFQPHFEENLANCSRWMRVHRQALPDDDVALDKMADSVKTRDHEKIAPLAWECGEPVEILFIDGAKSWTGLAYLLDRFRGVLTADASLLVCQDYKFWGSYWVPMMMEFFIDHFEMTHNLARNTVSFRLARELSAADLQRLPAQTDLHMDSGLELLESARRRLQAAGDRLGALILEGCKVRFCLNKGDPEAAIGRFRALESEWPGHLDSQTIVRMRDWLESEIGIRLSPSLRWRSGSVLRAMTQVKRRLAGGMA